MVIRYWPSSNEWWAASKSRHNEDTALYTVNIYVSSQWHCVTKWHCSILCTKTDFVQESRCVVLCLKVILSSLIPVLIILMHYFWVSCLSLIWVNPNWVFSFAHKQSRAICCDWPTGTNYLCPSVDTSETPASLSMKGHRNMINPHYHRRTMHNRR